MIELHLGDCLEVMPTLPQVDAIITDLPYGTTACSWDEIIPFEPMWEQVWRICKGAFVTTASQPFTSKLVMSNLDYFKYELIWDKVKSSQPHLSKYQPMKRHENALIFGNGKVKYNPVMVKKDKPRIAYGSKMTASNEHGLGLKQLPKYTITHSYPTSILVFSNADNTNRLHPTQKPVALYEYLIKTYTNEGDTVLDICAGSGTTGVACVNTNRNFIGIELREDYYKIMETRIAEAQLQMRLPI